MKDCAKTRALTPGGVGGSSGSTSGALQSGVQKKTSLEEKDGHGGAGGAMTEHRRVAQALVSMGPSEFRPGQLDLILVVRFNEGKNRLLTAPFLGTDDLPDRIADELIGMNFINPVKRFKWMLLMRFDHTLQYFRLASNSWLLPLPTACAKYPSYRPNSSRA